MPYVDERHYRVNELAKLWRFSRQKIIDLFKNEPGVLRLGADDNARIGRRRHRRYVILSIPESVAARVQARLGTRHSHVA